MPGQRILIVLGGAYHDFEGFAATIGPVLGAAGHTVEATYNLDRLLRLSGDHYDVVLMYTCIGARRDEGGEAETELQRFADAQIAGLVDWVQAGGSLLAVHAATVAGQTSSALRALMGGVFVSHPPIFSFPVQPLFREHPITAGIEAFAVHDEFYKELHDETVDLHMVALDRGVAYPMVWSKTEGQGRVAHIAMGHGQEVWGLEAYQRLMLQAITWLTD